MDWYPRISGKSIDIYSILDPIYAFLDSILDSTFGFLDSILGPSFGLRLTLGFISWIFALRTQSWIPEPSHGFLDSVLGLILDLLVIRLTVKIRKPNWQICLDSVKNGRGSTKTGKSWSSPQCKKMHLTVKKQLSKPSHTSTPLPPINRSCPKNSSYTSL